MEPKENVWNQSVLSQDRRTMADSIFTISDTERATLTTVNSVFLSGLISLFGIIANVINMAIFYSHKLTTTINISFFAMAVSDLCGLMFQQLFNVYINPLCQDLGWPIVYLELQHMTSGVPREVFARVTCLITVYITAERCLCIAYPLHVKQMITPRRTTIVIALLYTVTFAYIAPIYISNYIGWNGDPFRNRSLLMIIARRGNGASQTAVYFIHGLTGFVSFLTVAVLTLVLIQKLNQKSAWRETASSHQDKTMSKRDRSTMSMVALIASILIVCYTPAVLLSAVTFFVPEFNFGGRYFNIYYMLWSFALVLENVNSSVNIFLYFKMSSKFRKSFQEIFQKCRLHYKSSTAVHGHAQLKSDLK